MAVSKKRKKDGKVVKQKPRMVRGASAEQESGVTLQDLINALAYQEYIADGTISEEKAFEDAKLMFTATESEQGLDFEDPDTKAIIKAVQTSNIDINKNIDIVNTEEQD